MADDSDAGRPGRAGVRDPVARGLAAPLESTACPARIKLRTGLSEFTVKGVLPTTEAAPLLGAARSGDMIKLVGAAAIWLAGHPKVIAYGS